MNKHSAINKKKNVKIKNNTNRTLHVTELPMVLKPKVETVLKSWKMVDNEKEEVQNEASC